MVHTHNGDTDRILQCLSPEDQAVLAELLGRLEQGWNEEHARRHVHPQGQRPPQTEEAPDKE